MEEWKYKLIKEPKLLTDNCKSKYIAIPFKKDKVYLLTGVRPRNMDGFIEVI
jgi:hypothetical protein